jgi:hypothetical protein
MFALLVLLAGCASVGDDDDSAWIAGDDDDSDGLCDAPGTPDTVPWDPECRVEIELSEEPALEVVWQLAAFTPEPDHDQVMMTPLVVPLTDDDGDGLLGPGDSSAVVFATFAGVDFNGDGILRAARGDGSGLLWSNDVRDWRVQPDAGIAAGDIDGDGWPEIIAVGEDQHLLAFEHDGTGKWRSDAVGVADRGAVALADLNGDGLVEIVFGSQIYDSTGILRAQGEHGTGANPGRPEFPVPVVADLDGNGVQEVVVGNAIYDAAGGALWFHGEDDGFVGIGNFDEDDAGEIVVVSENTLRILDTNGLAIRGPVELIADGSGGPPTVADFDGDGEPEIGVANRAFYAVYDTDLSVLWSNETRDYSSSITGSSAFDFDGDGSSEVVYADERDVFVWDGRTGDVVHQGTGHASGTQIEYPVVARLTPNGPPAIVVGSNTLITDGWNGITVLADAGRSWAPTRGVWNQHAFLPTHVDDAGVIPPFPDSAWQVGQGLRQNEVVTAPGVPTPNLAVEPHAVCFDACPDFVRVRLRAVNTGHGAGPFAIGVFGPDHPDAAASAQLSQGLAQGARSAPLDLLVPAGVAALGMTARADVGDGVLECDEEDNVLTIAPAVCPE